MKLQSILCCAAMVGALSSASAIEMTISGSTAGSFNGAAFGSPTSLGGLTFTGATPFTETTVGNFASLVLGNFNLSNSNFDYAGDTFRVQFNFTAPSGILPGGPAIYSANMFGAVNANSEGGVGISFGGPQTFTFTTPTSTGSFVLTVNSLNVQPGIPSVDLTGSVVGGSQVTSVPDGGSSVAMLGLGLLGLTALGRKHTRVA
ncbi:MAG: VPDSG-CTERM sorting domain-containing protein [Verrucomicrobiota bacterium]